MTPALQLATMVRAMEPEFREEDLGRKWRQVLSGIRDGMLRACLPTSADKVHLLSLIHI